MYGNSLVVQWLELWAFTAEGLGSIPGQGTKFLQASWCGQNKTKQIYGTSLAVQWLRLHASTAGCTGSTPGQGTKIPQAE